MVEILRLHILLDSFNEVHSQKGRICFICFHGDASSKYFQGRVCPGGVDTQLQLPGEFNTLSARYILEGTDYTGASCKIFIENNGVDKADGSPMQTIPQIYTDSPSLKWFESATLSGAVCHEDGELIIHIYAEGENTHA